MDVEGLCRLPLSSLMGSAYRVVVATGLEGVPRVCFAGELAEAHPTLHTFRVPELAQCLRHAGAGDDLAGVVVAAVTTRGRLEVDPSTVWSLMERHPLLTEEEISAAWKRWSRQARSAYVRLRRAGLEWLGVRDGAPNTPLRTRLLVASWAADRVEVLW